jgi:DNA-binding transcriptional LysR family regulator
VELRQLRYFVILAEERHFGRAAGRLRIAQPGLSQQIKALERSVGATLFDREARPVALTEAGQRLLPHARAIVESATRAVEATRNARGRAGPVLKVGVPVIGRYPELGELVEAFRERHPEADLRLVPSMTPAMLQALSARTLDVAMVHQPYEWLDEAEAPDYVRLGNGELLIVLPVGHALARHEHVAREQLLEEPFVHSPDGLWPRFVESMHRTLFGVARHPRPVVVPDAIDPDSRVRLVAEGQGFTAISVPAGSDLPSTRDGVVFRRLQDPPALIEYGLAWLETNASPVTRSFVELGRGQRAP